MLPIPGTPPVCSTVLLTLRLFQRSKGKFYRSVGSTVEHTGSVPGIDEFTDFWGGIWE